MPIYPNRRRLYLTWCAPIAFALVAGCAGSSGEIAARPPEMISLVQYTTVGAAFDMHHLHLVNIDDVQRLRSELQRLLRIDVLSLSGLLDHYRLSLEERERIQKALTLIAVQNEKFPVP